MPGPAGCLALHPPGVGATNTVTGLAEVLGCVWLLVVGWLAGRMASPRQDVRQGVLGNVSRSHCRRIRRLTGGFSWPKRDQKIYLSNVPLST